ncbi:MAG: S9 family peptidase, partial [Alphaproteobacteria bacterium]|nr:S9 family peptidase [Alphaproteobacteria bacterium]
MTEIASYGAWRSPITSELIVAESLGIADIRADGGDIYWIEGRPSDAGRNVVVRRGPRGTVDDVTPPPYSVRTRVHEYGGGAMNVHRGFVYFTNFADQRLYHQAGGMEPMPLTPPRDPQQGGLRWRYADGILDEPRRRWIGVREEHAEGRVDNTLVAVELAKPGPGTVLAQGADFYASP